MMFEKGSRGTAGRIAVRALPNGLPYSRLAAIAGKGCGNAVKRNRLRRRIRAAYRMQKEVVPEGWDVAVIARPGLLEADWRDVMQEVKTAVLRAVGQECGRPRSRPGRSAPGNDRCPGP